MLELDEDNRNVFFAFPHDWDNERLENELERILEEREDDLVGFLVLRAFYLNEEFEDTTKGDDYYEEYDDYDEVYDNEDSNESYIYHKIEAEGLGTLYLNVDVF